MPDFSPELTGAVPSMVYNNNNNNNNNNVPEIIVATLIVTQCFTENCRRHNREMHKRFNPNLYTWNITQYNERAAV